MPTPLWPHRWPDLRPPAAAAALVFAALSAPAEHWVSIGAYRAVDAAQNLAQEASAEAGVPFSARPIETDAGELFRVLAGPYDGRREALNAMEEVQLAGFEQAWVIGGPARAAVVAPVGTSPSVDAVAAQPLAASQPAAAADYRTDIDALLENTWEDDLPPIEELLRGLPDLDTPLPTRRPVERPASEREEQPAPPAVAPENYRLHRLIRDARRPARRDGRDEPAELFAGFDARMKWYSTARSLPPGDAQRLLTGESTPLDHNADLRLMWRGDIGPAKLLVDHSTTWIRSAVPGGSPGLTFDQTPTGDNRRLMQLTWSSEDDDRRLVHRFDRLAVEYRTRQWGVTVGRQALSWGGGLAFQPMDLFNPFAPTTVDQDYKAGDDMILVERAFADGSELQMLAVARRGLPAPGEERGDPKKSASSLAAKYRAVLGDNEVEAMAAHHYGESVAGVGLRVPVGGALVRSDLTWTVTPDGTVLSGVVNADYTFSVAGSPVHVFGEYFHNGFGVTHLPSDLSALPPALLDRVVNRGELFNLMRNYAAFGASFRWHYLVNQSIALVGNLHDRSFVAQTSLTYDSSDASRLQLGLAKPFGSPGDEFGELAVGEDLTVGGGDQGYLRFVYYF